MYVLVLRGAKVRKSRQMPAKTTIPALVMHCMGKDCTFAGYITLLMKLTFTSLLLLTGFAFSSCQKELSYEVATGTTGGGGSNGSGGGGGSSNGYYIKGKKEGASFSFTNVPMTNIISAGGSVMVSMSANASANGSSLEGMVLSLSFSNGTNIATTTYVENDGSLDHSISGDYNPNSMSIGYGAGLAASTVKPLKITIATKTNTEITGTFEGAFYKTDVVAGTMSTTEYITFTEGEFKLPIK